MTRPLLALASGITSRVRIVRQTASSVVTKTFTVP